MPVKLMYTRQDDMKYGRCRPASINFVRAALGGGSVLGYQHHMVSPEMDLRHGFGEAITSMGGDHNNFGYGQTIFNLTCKTPYKLGLKVPSLYEFRLEVPTAPYRVVYNGQYSTVNELVIRELAEHLGVDEVEYRRSLLDNDRGIAVLDTLAEAGQWGRSLPDGGGSGHRDARCCGARCDEDVSQCGYCQAGQIMQAVDLLTRIPNPTDADIDEAMDNVCSVSARASSIPTTRHRRSPSWQPAPGHCRCGTYFRIRTAIKRVAAAGPGGLGRAVVRIGGADRIARPWCRPAASRRTSTWCTSRRPMTTVAEMGAFVSSIRQPPVAGWRSPSDPPVGGAGLTGHRAVPPQCVGIRLRGGRSHPSLAVL